MERCGFNSIEIVEAKIMELMRERCRLRCKDERERDMSREERDRVTPSHVYGR